MKLKLLIFSCVLSGFVEATSFFYQYDADGRMLSVSKSEDVAVYSPTLAHNLSEVLAMGDANTNGMPDSLEAYLAGYWGPDYNPMTCDSDGDGVCDWNEWMLGTNPFSYDSCFAGWGCGCFGSGGPMDPYDYTLAWSSVPFKSYTVEYREHLSDSSWIVGATNLVATPPVNCWTHEDITNRHTFYRVLTEIPLSARQVSTNPVSTNSVPEAGAQ